MDEKKSERPASYLKENYGMILGSYLPAELRQPGISSPRVLSVACGFALELEGLQQVLPNSYIEAIDNADIAITGARGWNPDFPQERIRLVDATRSESFGNENWDLIVVRNPNVGSSAIGVTAPWAEILKNCFDKLNPSGFLYLTTLSKIEMDGVLRFLSHFPLEDVTPNDPNRTHVIYLPIEVGFPLIEDYVAVLKKPALPS